MKNILLVCSAGMSTSLLVTKMRQAAAEQGVATEINAIAEAELHTHLSQANVVLLGPQVRFLLGKVREAASPLGIPVEVINSVAYGTMDGKSVLAEACRLAK